MMTEIKTKVTAEPGKQELYITREFNLPLELLFKAYTEAQFVEQWMGTSVQKLDSKKHGGYVFETKDTHGNLLLRSSGVIHGFQQNQHIYRTFEMETTPFPAQMEYLEFEELTPRKSKLTMHVVYKSVTIRDNILKLPFIAGINMAHNKLESLFN